MMMNNINNVNFLNKEFIQSIFDHWAYSNRERRDLYDSPVFTTIFDFSYEQEPMFFNKVVITMRMEHYIWPLFPKWETATDFTYPKTNDPGFIGTNAVHHRWEIFYDDMEDMKHKLFLYLKELEDVAGNIVTEEIEKYLQKANGSYWLYRIDQNTRKDLSDTSAWWLKRKFKTLLN